MTAQFRFIGAISPNFDIAIRYCGVLLLLYIVFGGYLISTENLLDNVPWFGWLLVRSLIFSPRFRMCTNRNVVHPTHNIHLRSDDGKRISWA